MSPFSHSGSSGGRADLLVLVLLTLTSMTLAALPSPREAALARTLRASLLAPFLAVHETVARHARLNERLERVRAERDSVAHRLMALQAELWRTRGTGRRTGPETPPGIELITTGIHPGRPREGTGREFLLRIGSDRGLTAPAGVFAPSGLVGVLRRVEDGWSVGDYWTHPDFRVGVRTRDGSASGIVRPSLEEEQPLMILEGAPYQRDLPAGTRLYTAGIGGVFPPGIPVGVVRELLAVESGWERSYRVEPSVRPASVTTVLVWRRDPLPR